jgi:curved DNA-binding protein CbpA
MGTNLYVVLGVERTATRKQIQTAYRRKAKQYHPDKGGDADAFKAIQQAWDVLGDEVRRKQYDETGSIENHIDQGDALLHQELFSLLTQLLSQSISVEHIDIMESVRTHLDVSRRQCFARIEQNEQDVKKRRQVVSRLSRATGDNFLTSGLQGQIVEIESNTSLMRQHIENIEKLVELSAEYTYDVTPSPVSTFTNSYQTVYIPQI